MTKGAVVLLAMGFKPVANNFKSIAINLIITFLPNFLSPFQTIRFSGYLE